MGLGPRPSAFPNLETQMELDKLRRSDGRSRRTYPDTWSDASQYQSQKDAMEKSAQLRQSRSTDTHAETSHKQEGSTREVMDRAKCRSQSRGWEEDTDPLVQGAEGGGTSPPDQEPEIEEITAGGTDT